MMGLATSKPPRPPSWLPGGMSRDAAVLEVCLQVQQVRRRDSESRDVIIEERRYDRAGPEGTPTFSHALRDRDPMATSTAESLDQANGADLGPPIPLPLQALSAGFGNTFADDDAVDNPYAWAQRLREIPDKVCGCPVP